MPQTKSSTAGVLDDLMHRPPSGSEKQDTAQALWEVETSLLNVRSEPNADSQVVGELDMGDVVVQLEEQDGWVKHSKGWNATSHPDIPELHFLKPKGADCSEPVSYEQQRASMEKQVRHNPLAAAVRSLLCRSKRC